MTHGRPQLTSLVDMMTILLVFLLKSFSVEEERLVAADLTLPVSTSEVATADDPVVVIARDAVLVDRRMVVDLTTIDADDPGAWVGLTDALRDLRTGRTGSTAATTAPDTPGAADAADAAGAADAVTSDGDRTRVSVQCDRDHEFALVKHVMNACRSAGYEGLALVVRLEG